MHPDRASIFSTLADALEHDWRSIARPEQLPPPGDWSVWVYLAGRGAGKTRSGAEAVREWVESGKCKRIALIAPTAGDARDVMVEGESGLMAVFPDSTRPIFEPWKRRIVFKSGAVASLFSAEEADRLRRPSHDGIWFDELAAYKGAQSVWDMAMFGLRLGRRPQAIVTTTPRPIPLLKALLKRDGLDVAVARGKTADNAQNLAPSFLGQIVSRYAGTRLGRQELDAEMLEDAQGALWTRDLVDAGRRDKSEIPPMLRIVVAIDPAVSVGENADDTGIIVACIDAIGHGYVLEDASGKFLPIEWARRAVALYRKWNADRVVSEKNQGGDMVETTVRTVDANVSYKAVHASRGKITRAEPIAALAEQHRIHHVGAFPELEDELCTYTAGSAKSPDRLDAFVWAMTELMLDANGNTGFIDFYRSQSSKLPSAATAPAATQGVPSP